MPLPLPTLDTRRWADLVEEGRALIPRYAPEWTDHNVHDPGITLMELLAWVVEQEIYRNNRIPDAHRLKFLKLLGLAPQPPKAARVPVTLRFNNPNPTLTLPANTLLHANSSLPFRTLSELSVVDAHIVAARTSDGETATDLTRLLEDGIPIHPFGINPAVDAAFYVGFARPLPVGVRASIWFWFEGARGSAEREAIRTVLQQHADACVPIYPETQACEPAPPAEVGDTPEPPLQHHSVRTVWEYFDGADWIAFPDDAITDETRAFSLNGAMHLRPAAAMQADPQDGRFYLRCRITAGRHDCAPVLRAMALNTVSAEQSTLHNDVLATGDNTPRQTGQLLARQIADGSVALSGDALAWRQVDGLDASQRSDAHFVVDATRGEVTFGDGELGRVLPTGSQLTATYKATVGSAGNVRAGAHWQLDDAALDALLHATNRVDAESGAAAETLEQVAGRAAATLWAHERLVELCPAGQLTFDQLPRERLLARRAPQRATTVLDFERLVFDVPGTAIARARAWAALDAAYPCYNAPGTVTVVIVPHLPQGRPQPTPALRELVHAHLNMRRIIGTRLIVVGPDYLTVRVVADVRARRGQDVGRVQADIERSLADFLDPLKGGPAGLGWPFGRNVYRSEILQVIDNVSGVDHVLSLSLFADDGEHQCDNICLSATMLTESGKHQIEVRT